MDGTAGHIEVVYGPMFSGKTSELIRRIRRYRHGRKRCLVIKWKGDSRYNADKAATHDSQLEEAIPLNHLIPGDEDYPEFAKLVSEADVIGVDEGQFFPDILEFCETMANLGKIIVVAALDSTFQRKPFGGILELVAIAEKAEKLSAVCKRCTKDAAFSKRISNETEVNVIGGADKYVASCRSCFAKDWGKSVSK